MTIIETSSDTFIIDRNIIHISEVYISKSDNKVGIILTLPNNSIYKFDSIINNNLSALLFKYNVLKGIFKNLYLYQPLIKTNKVFQIFVSDNCDLKFLDD